MEKDKYAELKYLLSHYFYEDMHLLEYDSPEEALKIYTFESDESSIEEVLSDIRKLKEENLEAEKLWNLIEQMGCKYRYDDYYSTPEKWLDYISSIIKSHYFDKLNLIRE